MIIIPEIETVLLQPPRTGTSSVKDAVLAHYPKAFAIYRHMEYAGIPAGYERWRVVSQVRDPLDRMKSLFQYMRNPEVRSGTDKEWLASVQKDTAQGFEHWLLHGRYVFANPSPSPYTDFRPRYMVRYPFREQIKSQSLWAAPADEIIRYESLVEDARVSLNIDLGIHRGRSLPVDIEYTEECRRHMWRYHSWDMGLYYCGGRVD